MLEPILPLDETIKLVEERQGKGYYQLAIRYAQGNELPEDRGVAYKLLCKACDVNYANAVLVEGLCDEADLQECIPGSKIRRPAEMSDWMHGYCGTVFYSGRRDCDFLTNFKLLVVTRITRAAAYERNLHYAVATISATGNVANIGPELGSVNIYVGTD